MTVTAGRSEYDLAEQLTALVAAQPGVLRVYSAHSAPSDLVSQAVSSISLSRKRPPVRVIETATGTAISILVGVDGERAAIAICHNIYENVTKETVAAGATTPLAIAITIASIE